MAMYLGDKPVKAIVRSKNNLLNIEDFSLAYPRQTAEVLAGGTAITFYTNGQLTSKFVYKLTVETGKTYTVSLKDIVGTTTTGIIQYGFFVCYSSNPDTAKYGFCKPGKPVTFVATSTALYIKGYVSYDAKDAFVTLICPQVNEGSTALPYEPYNQLFTVPIKKCVGKNLFDISQANVTVDGEYFESNVSHGESFYNLRVTPGKTYSGRFTILSPSADIGRQLALSVMPGENRGYGSGFLSIRLIDSNSEYTNTFKFIVPNNVTWVSFNTLMHHRLKDLMINEGDTALPYEPYKEWYEY